MEKIGLVPSWIERMKDETTSGGGADNSGSVETNQALRLLEEMDDLITQLGADRPRKTQEIPSPTTPSPTTPTQTMEMNSATSGATTSDRIDEAVKWIEHHTALLESRRQQLDDQATAVEIQESDLKDTQLRLAQDSQKIKQEWAALAEEKESLKQLRARAAREKKISETGEKNPKDDAQAQRIVRQRRQIERAWKLLKKEKEGLVQQRRRLKLQAKRLADRPESTSRQQSDRSRQELQDQFNELRAGQAVVDFARQQYAELLEQRQILVESKRFLCATEQEMIRRWSVNRGVGLVGGAVSCILFLLLFSYEVGHRIVDPVWRAGTVVGLTATVFNESHYGQAWVTKQHQLVISDEMVSEAIRMGAQRGVRLFEDSSEMRDALNRGLTIRLRAPGKILFEYEDTNRHLAVNVLKSLGRAFVSHHTMEDRLSGRPNSMRIYESAASDPVPIEDGRMVASGMTLVVSLASVTVLALTIWGWLSRSTRIFEQQAIPETDQLEDDSIWPPPPSSDVSEVDDSEEDEELSQQHEFI